MEGELARGGRRVDRLVKAEEPDPLVFKARHPADQVAQRSAETIEPPHHQRVTGAQLLLDLLQAWPGRDRSGCFVRDDLLAAGSEKRVFLQVEILLDGRNPRIAKFYGWPPNPSLAVPYGKKAVMDGILLP